MRQKERVAPGKYTAFVTERLGWSERHARNFVGVLRRSIRIPSACRV
jgi:hypothetical protein